MLFPASSILLTHLHGDNRHSNPKDYGHCERQVGSQHTQEPQQLHRTRRSSSSFRQADTDPGKHGTACTSMLGKAFVYVHGGEKVLQLLIRAVVLTSAAQQQWHCSAASWWTRSEHLLPCWCKARGSERSPSRIISASGRGLVCSTTWQSMPLWFL